MAPIMTAPRYSKELHVISDLEHHHCAIVHWAQFIAAFFISINHSWLKASKSHHPLQLNIYLFFASFRFLVVSVLVLGMQSPSFLDLYSLENLYRVYCQNLNYLRPCTPCTTFILNLIPYGYVCQVIYWNKMESSLLLSDILIVLNVSEIANMASGHHNLQSYHIINYRKLCLLEPGALLVDCRWIQ